MKLPLQIVFRDMAPLPALEPEIRRRAAKLDQWTNDILSCHVVVEAEANHHRTGHTYRVKSRVVVADDVIVSGDHHRDEDVFVALQGSFSALDRQLEDHARRRRGHVKSHPVVLHGHIEWLSEQGAGRIVSEAGEPYHFDRTLVEHPVFEHLAIGQDVRFVEALTRNGREARRVSAVAA